MSEMPNWFRWLIIIIATLIICACRAPIQDPSLLDTDSQLPQSVLVHTSAAFESLPTDPTNNRTTNRLMTGRPLLPPINATQQVTSRESLGLPRGVSARAAIVTPNTQASKDLASNQDPQSRIIRLLGGDPEEIAAAASHTSGACVCGPNHSAVRPVRANPNPAQISAAIPRTTATTRSSDPRPDALAPVVKQTKTGLRIQEVPRTVATPNDDRIAATRSSAPRRTTAAVYMRVNDEGVTPTVAQLDAGIGSQLGAEVFGGAGSPIATDPPLPPIVNPSIDPGAYPTATAYPIADQGTIPMDPMASPMLAEGAALPLEMQPQIYNPAPYEVYLPVEEVPIEASPERWAQDPYAQDGGMNLPQEELARHYPDEYICDGGDANGPAFVKNDWTVRNLDPEDTIGHFDTKAGEVVVAPSNRVCVYAPRFAATRQVTSAFAEEQVDQLLVAAAGTKAYLEEVDQPSVQLDAMISPKRTVLLQPASTFRKRTAGIIGVQRKAVNILAYDVSAHEDFRVMKLGIHKQSEKPRLTEYVAKAATWNKDTAVQVLIDEAIARTNVSLRGAETFFTIGDNGPAKLRVIKTASTADALPGEEVEFTLRFDNVGQQTIGNVTIIDNLTTRLEFVDDSDLCSVDSTFLVADNDAESLTLRWEIKEPIKPGFGGLIRFRCHVR